MGIRTKNLEQYGYKVLTRLATDMLHANVAVPAGTDAGGGTATLGGLGTGAPVFTEVSTAGFGGWLMNDGDIVSDLVVAPQDMNPSLPCYLRVLYTSSTTTAAHTTTFIAKYAAIPTDGANSIALGEAPAALDTPITTADVYGSTTAYLLKKTAFGKINQGLGKGPTARLGGGGELLHFQIEQDAADTAPIFLGYELWYHPVFFGEQQTPTEELAAPSDDT